MANRPMTDQLHEGPMDTSNRIVWSTVAVILVVMIVSGPLVGSIELTSMESSPTTLGTGSAEVQIDSVPTDAITLERSTFGAKTFHLSAPPSTVTIEDVRGNPVLEYAIQIPELGFVDINSYVVSELTGSTLRLTFRPIEISPSEVTQETYGGTVTIRLQADEFERLYESTITVEVRR